MKVNEVVDEIHAEKNEVKVYATANFENCPDRNLSEDYFASFREFILSDNHLQKNIADIKTVNLTSRQLDNLLFIVMQKDIVFFLNHPLV